MGKRGKSEVSQQCGDVCVCVQSKRKLNHYAAYLSPSSPSPECGVLRQTSHRLRRGVSNPGHGTGQAIRNRQADKRACVCVCARVSRSRRRASYILKEAQPELITVDPCVPGSAREGLVDVVVGRHRPETL